MSTQIVLLRGINIGPNNRIAMPALREAFAEHGMPDARTYIQSGNIVVDSVLTPNELTTATEALIATTFALKVPVVVRTRAELATVVEANPLRDDATELKLYQVSFLSAEPDPDVIAKLETVRVGPERVIHIGREIYSWHPAGVARSKLATALAGKLGGLTATARNWRTVTTLLEMADDRA